MFLVRTICLYIILYGGMIGRESITSYNESGELSTAVKWCNGLRESSVSTPYFTVRKRGFEDRKTVLFFSP